MEMYVNEAHDRALSDRYFRVNLPVCHGSRELDPTLTVYCPLATTHSWLAPSQ